MEHGANVEALRPRRGRDRTLWLSLFHRVSRRPPPGPCRGSAHCQARCDPPELTLRRVYPGRCRCHAQAGKRRGGQRRRADRCRRRAFAPARGAVREGLADVLGNHGLAGGHPDRAPARAAAPPGGHQLDRPGRAHHQLPAASRRTDELRRLRGALRLAGRIVERAGYQRRIRRRLQGLARGHPHPHPPYRHPVQVGAAGAPASGALDRGSRDFAG